MMSPDLILQLIGNNVRVLVMARITALLSLTALAACLGGSDLRAAFLEPVVETTSPGIETVQYIAGPRFPGDTAEFRNPRLNGTFVDACATWGQGCGAAGANQYCQLRHFTHALNWTIFKTNSTFLSSTNQFCHGTCQAFSYVKCG
jgi:hypothetical protein